MRDPGQLILKRALRVAILVPVTYFFVEVVLGLSNASLASAFACFSMLALADLGGPRRDRFLANAILGIVGVLLVSLGSFLGQWQWPVVVATVVVVFVISYSSVLRGYYAASTAAAIMPWVYAATAPPDASLTPVRALGWAIGAAVATVGAVVVWPIYVRSTLRLRLADVLDRAADVVAELDDQPRREAAYDKLLAARTALHEAYDGRLARPGAGTSRDRSLMQAIEEAGRLSTTLGFTHDQDAVLGSIDAKLCGAITKALRDSAEGLRSGKTEPSPAVLDAEREVHAERLADWCNERLAHGEPEKVRPCVEKSAAIRTVSLSAESMAIYVRGAMDPVRSRSRAASAAAEAGAQDAVTFAGHDILTPRRRMNPLTLLARQFTLHSPWLRTAIRTSVAIGITVYLVTLLGVEHGFWVALGALVALKFDASGTRRTAWQVLLGTILGFAIGCGLVLLIGTNPLPLWLLLPFVVFLAVYTPGVISLVVGQASFTLFVIVLLGITDPGRLNTAEWRLFDVVLGISVSLLVSLLMWPHGVAPMVARTARNAIYASTNFLMSGFERIVDGPITKRSVDTLSRQSANGVQRASEAFDLALSQRGPGLADSHSVVTTINVATELNFIGEVLEGLSRVGSLPASCALSGDSMLAAAHRVGTRIIALVNALQDPTDGPKDVAVYDQHRQSLARLRAAIDSDLSHLDPNVDAEVAGGGPTVHTDAGHTAMVLGFSLVWIAESVWLADQLESVINELASPKSALPG